MVDKISKEYNLFMPVSKSMDGNLVGLLSDTSLDRDEEFMGEELIKNWSSKSNIKALVNHDNKMQSWVGGWSGLKNISKNNHTALVAEPWFFSKEANPLAEQVRLQVEESLNKGEQPGISISAIMTDFENVKINGKSYRKFTKGELLEATWVPIQSNRNATFGHIAKQFDFNIEKENIENPNEKECNKAFTEEIMMEEEIIEKSEEVIEKATEEVEVTEKEVKEEVKEFDIKSYLDEKFDSFNNRIAEIEKKVESRKIEMKSISEDMENAIDKKEINKDVKPTIANILKAMKKEE